MRSARGAGRLIPFANFSVLAVREVSGSSIPLSEALERLYRRNLHTIKLGLDEMRALAKALGHPERAYLTLHVAGTNGKGSVCALLDAVLRSAGIRTGLYTSPHLVRFHERIQVQGEPIDDQSLIEGMDAVEAAAAKVREAGQRDVTFFEFTTALAFWHFRRSHVQVAVVETGMGGRLDATNIVMPLVAAITSIGLDHQQWLGNTLEKIAREKAGIIKSGRPVVMGPAAEEAERAIVDTARAVGARVVRAAQEVRVERIEQSLEGQIVTVSTGLRQIGPVLTTLLGRHQLANIAIAVAMLEQAEAALGIEWPGYAFREGLRRVRCPARAQVIDRDPPVLLDGAHNPDAMRVLVETVEEVRGQRPVVLMAGFLKDKDAVACLSPWKGLAKKVFLARIASDRAMSDEDLRSAARNAGWESSDGPEPVPVAFEAAREWARREGGMLVIAGSLYLAGEILALPRFSANRPG